MYKVNRIVSMLENTSNPTAQNISAGLPTKQWIDIPIRRIDDAQIPSATLGKSLFKFIISIVGNMKSMNQLHHFHFPLLAVPQASCSIGVLSIGFRAVEDVISFLLLPVFLFPGRCVEARRVRDAMRNATCY